MDGKSNMDNLKDTAEDTMENLHEASEDMQNRLGAVWEASREKVGTYARATDRSIREKPYQALGIALGFGVLIGMLLNRNRSNRNQQED